ncbi:hypothetical protein [Cloacibacterium rupense]|uniref:hypothetical protein n=1 Tax=Cloacibacterium rupense TaxID=517423 RepID=UPI00166E9D30|nr:hypothetical protein [Cloacibacterium rupense]
MAHFTLLPTLIIITFIGVVLYKHYIKKEKQDLKSSFLFVLFFVAIWGLLYYFVFS